MSSNHSLEYEFECVRAAAGRPAAEIQAAAPLGRSRYRSYILDGLEGGSFVKCVDSGPQDQPSVLPSLDHEADGYRFFAGWEGDEVTLPRVHFFERFPGATGGELQVLGLSNLAAHGSIQSLRAVYQSAQTPDELKKGIAGSQGRALARLISAGYQSTLDQAAGVAAIRRQTKRVLEHPARESLLADVRTHKALPWAYQNRVMGEMNVLLPGWITDIRRDAAPELNRMLDLLVRTFDRDLVGALAPGQSADRLVFSPGDRSVGNTLLVWGQDIWKLYEVNFECWGLETGGRMIGRYLDDWQLTLTGTLPVRSSIVSGPDDGQEQLHSDLVGAFCFNFVRGDGQDTPDVVYRALSLGLAGFHAAISRVYLAALGRTDPKVLIQSALDLLQSPDQFLAMAAEFGSRLDSNAAPIVETIVQVREALTPLLELASRSS